MDLRPSKEITTSNPPVDEKGMSLEFISFSDGKEAVARAVNFLFEKHYSSENKEKPNFTESDMAGALREIGLPFLNKKKELLFGNRLDEIFRKLSFLNKKMPWPRSLLDPRWINKRWMMKIVVYELRVPLSPGEGATQLQFKTEEFTRPESGLSRGVYSTHVGSTNGRR
ncbi:Ditrans [Forsythia ovata]|uniref:ditrans,polycis-polyprenyl diphosphate synthase [(2E,6E)-farnesyldiphosphate specific] n=1 Tax=Forsythia ovata TaxID=205694 RepID=A0ABD1T8J2_9LAMI